GGIGIEVYHVAGLFGRLSSGIHRDADVGLGKSWSIIGPVSSHCYQFAICLLAADQVHLVFWRGLSKKVIHACFAGNCSRSERIVSSDHYSANSHCPKLIEAVADTTLNDVL